MDKRNKVGRLLLSQNDDGNHDDNDIDGFAISDNLNETYLEDPECDLHYRVLTPGGMKPKIYQLI